MTREIEIKLPVESHEPIRQRLRDLGADFLRTGIETNWIYDRSDGSLRTGGFGLRLRTVDVASGKPFPTTLTVKGPLLPGPLKERDELEVTVDNAETANQMLAMLGFTCILKYQKRRESWRFMRCNVELDEPPHVGLFVEIEGPDDGCIRAVQESLGLGSVSHTPQSYPHLLLAYCKSTGLATHDVRLP